MKQNKPTDHQYKSKGRVPLHSALTLLLILAVLGYLPLVPPGPRHAALNLGSAVAGGIAFGLGWLQFRQSRQVPRTHLASLEIRRHGVGWFLLGLGSLCAAFGFAYGAVSEILGVQPPAPSPAEVGCLLLYPMQIAGIACLFRLNAPLPRLRQVADGFIASAATFVITWQLAVEPLWYGATTPLSERLIAFAYPALDVVSLFGVLVLAAVTTRSMRDAPIYLMLCVGIVCLTLADIMFARDTLRNAYQTSRWYDIFWTAGQVGIVLSSIAARKQLRALIDDPPLADKPLTESIESYLKRGHTTIPPDLHRLRLPTRFQSALPYSLTAVTILFTVTHEALKPSKHPTLSGAVLLLTVLIIARQGLTLLENRCLMIALHKTSTTLDTTVKKRTLQLAVLHELIVAVNDTLDQEQVLAATLHHTRRAVNADAFAVWLCPGGGAKQTLSLPHCSEGLSAWPGLTERLRVLPLPETTIRQSLQSLLPELPASDMARAEALPRNIDDIASCLLTPLVARGQYLGVLAALRWDDTFTETDTEVIEGISRAVGTALHNAGAYHEARRAADRDPLTDLLNHRAVQERMHHALAEAEKTNQEVAVLMIDVNNFKLLNDTHGHLVGDEMLRRIAASLIRVCPSGTIIGRYGGDEFFVGLPGLLPGQGDLAADTLAHAIASELGQEVFLPSECMMPSPGIVPGGKMQLLPSLPIAASVGVAIYPRDGSTRHGLLTHADRNMYQAKYGGRPVVARPRRGMALEIPMPEVMPVAVTGTLGLLDAMIQAIDNKDQYTRRHSEDVTEYALCLLQAMEGEESVDILNLRTLQVAGLLHDIGKIGVHDEILRKPGALTNEEEEAMRRHPLTGALIVGAMPELAHLPNLIGAIRAHHERWDGSGYPDGLRGEAIPYLGRILAVADAFDAMTSDRPYRKAFTRDEALRRVARGAGTQFDPAIAQVFVEAAPNWSS